MGYVADLQGQEGAGPVAGYVPGHGHYPAVLSPDRTGVAGPFCCRTFAHAQEQGRGRPCPCGGQLEVRFCNYDFGQ